MATSVTRVLAIAILSMLLMVVVPLILAATSKLGKGGGAGARGGADGAYDGFAVSSREASPPHAASFFLTKDNQKPFGDWFMDGVKAESESRDPYAIESTWVDVACSVRRAGANLVLSMECSDPGTWQLMLRRPHYVRIGSDSSALHAVDYGSSSQTFRSDSPRAFDLLLKRVVSSSSNEAEEDLQISHLITGKNQTTPVECTYVLPRPDLVPNSDYTQNPTTLASASIATLIVPLQSSVSQGAPKNWVLLDAQEKPVLTLRVELPRSTVAASAGAVFVTDNASSGKTIELRGLPSDVWSGSHALVACRSGNGMLLAVLTNKVVVIHREYGLNPSLSYNPQTRMMSMGVQHVDGRMSVELERKQVSSTGVPDLFDLWMSGQVFDGVDGSTFSNGVLTWPPGYEQVNAKGTWRLKYTVTGALEVTRASDRKLFAVVASEAMDKVRQNVVVPGRFEFDTTTGKISLLDRSGVRYWGTVPTYSNFEVHQLQPFRILLGEFGLKVESRLDLQVPIEVWNSRTGATESNEGGYIMFGTSYERVPLSRSELAKARSEENAAYAEALRAACTRPSGWCQAPGEVFSKGDCEGNGVDGELYCRSAQGAVTSIKRSTSCTPQPEVRPPCNSSSKVKCVRPKGWCTAPGSTFMTGDCEGNGVRGGDLFCKDANGGVRSKKRRNECNDLPDVAPGYLSCGASAQRELPSSNQQRFMLKSTAKNSLCVQTSEAEGGIRLNACKPSSLDQQFVYDRKTSQIRNPNKGNLCLDDVLQTGRIELRPCNTNFPTQKFAYTGAEKLLWSSGGVNRTCMDDDRTISPTESKDIHLATCKPGSLDQSFDVVPI